MTESQMSLLSEPPSESLASRIAPSIAIIAIRQRRPHTVKVH